MKLITAEELIAASNGTVFTTQVDNNSKLDGLYIKTDFKDGTIYSRNLLLGEECETRHTLHIPDNRYNYYIYSEWDLQVMVMWLDGVIN